MEFEEILELCSLGWDLKDGLKSELSKCVTMRRSSTLKPGKGETYGVSFSFEPRSEISDEDDSDAEPCILVHIKRQGTFSIKFETNRGYSTPPVERLTIRVQCSSSNASGIVYQSVAGATRTDPIQHTPMLQRFLSATGFPLPVYIPFLILASKEMGTSKGHVLPRKQIQRYCKELEEELQVDAESRSRSSYGEVMSAPPIQRYDDGSSTRASASPNVLDQESSSDDSSSDSADEEERKCATCPARTPRNDGKEEEVVGGEDEEEEDGKAEMNKVCRNLGAQNPLAKRPPLEERARKRRRNEEQCTPEPVHMPGSPDRVARNSRGRTNRRRKRK